MATKTKTTDTKVNTAAEMNTADTTAAAKTVKPAAEKKTKAAAAKKEAKAPAKKPAVKADAPVKEAVKESVYLQYNGIEAETQELTERAKQHWADAGNDLKDMKSIAIYVNATEMMVYYVVNDTEKGQFSLA